MCHFDIPMQLESGREIFNFMQLQTAEDLSIRKSHEFEMTTLIKEKMAINSEPHIHHQIICANIFIRKGDKYLVLKRSMQKRYAPGVVMPVGGKVDSGENPYETAIREAYEETGVKVKNVHLEAVLLEITPIKNEPYDWLVFHFSSDYESGKVIETDEGELMWLTAEEFLQKTLFPSVQPVAKHIFNKKAGTVFATYEYDEARDNIIKAKIDLCTLA